MLSKIKNKGEWHFLSDVTAQLDTNMGIVGISCRTLDPGLDATMNKSIGRRISPDGEHETGCKLQIRVCQFDSKY